MQHITHSPGLELGNTASCGKSLRASTFARTTVRQPVPARRLQRRSLPPTRGRLRPAPTRDARRGEGAAGREEHSAREFYFESHYNDQHVRILTAQLVAGLSTRIGSRGTADERPTKSSREIRLWLILVAIGGVGIASIAGLPRRSRLAQAGARARRRRRTRARNTRPHAANRGRAAATSSAASRPPRTRCSESLDEASQSAAPTRAGRLTRAAHAAHEPARTSRCWRCSDGGLAPEEREQLLADVVAQLGEMTGADRGADRARARRGAADGARGAAARPARPRTGSGAPRRNRPDIAIETDLAPTTVAGCRRASSARSANLLDNAAKWSPEGGTGRGEARGPRGDRARPRARHRRGDRPHVFERFYRAPRRGASRARASGSRSCCRWPRSHGGTVVGRGGADGGTRMRMRLDTRVVAEPTATGSPGRGVDPHLHLGAWPRLHPGCRVDEPRCGIDRNRLARRAHESERRSCDRPILCTTIQAAGQHPLRHLQLGVEAAHDGR